MTRALRRCRHCPPDGVRVGGAGVHERVLHRVGARLLLRALPRPRWIRLQRHLLQCTLLHRAELSPSVCLSVCTRTQPKSVLSALQLIVYGSGSVDPSTLQVLSPGLRYSVAVAISPDAEYGRLVLVMGKGFCTDAAGHPFTRTPNSTFTLRFGTPSPCTPGLKHVRRRDGAWITGSTVRLVWFQIEGATP